MRAHAHGIGCRRVVLVGELMSCAFTCDLVVTLLGSVAVIERAYSDRVSMQIWSALVESQHYSIIIPQLVT